MGIELNNLLSRFSNIFAPWQWNRGGYGRIERISWYGQQNVRIDCEDPLTAYNGCPHLQMTLDRKAMMFSNGQWKCYAVGDTELKDPIDNDPGIALLKNPNVIQSGEDFLKQYIFYKDLFSNNFIYKLSGSRLVEPKALWHLPSNMMEIVLTGKFFDQYELDKIIKQYELNWGGMVRSYSVAETIYKAENFNVDQGKGMSKIPALTLPINNIVAALKTRNILIVNKGIFGFMSSEAKDQAGSISIGDKERERIEAQFAADANLYSDRAKIKIVNTPTKWNSMSVPTKDMLLFEETEDDFAIILSEFGMDRDLFPSTKGATFENKKQAEILTYTSTIQPEADAFAELMTKELGAAERGVRYVLDYSWLPVMQRDRQVEEVADKVKAEKLAILLDKNVIDRQTFADMMGVELSVSGDGVTDLGKLPLALQQLALARERAITAGDTATSEAIGKKINDLLDKIN